MGNDTISVTANDEQMAKMTITNILMTSEIGKNSNLKFDELVSSLGLTDAIERIVAVKACDNAWIRHYQNLVHDIK